MPPSRSTLNLKICLVTHVVRRNDGQGRVNFEVAKAALEQGHHLTILAVTCAQELIDHPAVTWVEIGNPKLPTQLLRDLYFANQ